MGAQARGRWILWSAVGVALAAAAVALGTFWAVPHGLERYRERIERSVSQSTGRTFHLQGPLRLRLAPLAIEAGSAQLGNPPSIPGPPLATWRSIRIAFELLPLLHHHIVVDEVRLDALRVHLQRTTDGRANWSGLFAGRGGAPAPGAATASAVDLRTLEVRDGELDLADAGRVSVRLSSLSLEARPARFVSRLQIGSVRLTGQVWRPGMRASSPVRLDLADIDLAQSPDRLFISHASLRTAGLLADGSLTAAGADDSWQVRGTLSARVASVRGFAETFGVIVPRTRDPAVLAKLALTGGWMFARGALEFESLHAQLDDTTITGRISYRGAAKPPLLELDLHGDQVDLDRYMNAGSAPSGRPEISSSRRSEFSIAELRALPITGTVAFDQARLAETEMHQVRLEFR